jgi:hypothetical protein
MVGCSVIKGLTPDHQSSTTQPATSTITTTKGYVRALVLIASGFVMSGYCFMDPLFGHPPPSWRIDKPSGYAVLIQDPKKMFYHDVPSPDAEVAVSNLTTQSLKSLFEGGEHVYSGWRDVRCWYIGTSEDWGLPVAFQRFQVEVARGYGADITHVELRSSHSPFLSMPEEVVTVLLDAVRTVGKDGAKGVDVAGRVGDIAPQDDGSGKVLDPTVRLFSPGSWVSYGIPLMMGRPFGWSFWAFWGFRGMFRQA